MTAVLLTALFAFAATAAMASILVTVRRYGAQMWNLDNEVRTCPSHREYRVTLRTVVVSSEGARILRPRFTQRRSVAALPAAA